MSSGYCFVQIEKTPSNSRIIEQIEEYSESNKRQTYIINRPLGDPKYSYAATNAFVILVPKHKLIFANMGDTEAIFDEYIDEFIEDLGSISDKFRYKDIIGRPRVWREHLVHRIYSPQSVTLDSIMSETLLSTGEHIKICDMLISLLTGSINDVEKIGPGVPSHVLDKVKQKIVLFDGDQTRFIYEKVSGKQIRIQGLSGTGKTELLLHKLKEIYSKSDCTRIMFTCHNKILASELRRRIPDFFNFMKVERQILWEERLWCVNAWGSTMQANSGAYRLICGHYGIPFSPYSPSFSFDTACTNAARQLSEELIAERGYAFDYMFIDESQDFPESFFELCKKVTANTVFIAGDIFQSIFEDKENGSINPDYLLTKCYRTDPRTLMFSHSLGMGLFENPPLRWMNDQEWNNCGYNVERISDTSIIRLTREPLRRFEDLTEEGLGSVEILPTQRDIPGATEALILNIIKTIKSQHPTAQADDISILFATNSKRNFALADKLEISIFNHFEWRVNKAYETKMSIKDRVVISNRNNVKGLEFPFVICVVDYISNNFNDRNSLYMMLTRSFIKSYMVIDEPANTHRVGAIQASLESILYTGAIETLEPSADIKESLRTTIINAARQKPALLDTFQLVCEELEIPSEARRKLYAIVAQVFADKVDYERMYTFTDMTYRQICEE